jgi:hypothetical protein
MSLPASKISPAGNYRQQPNKALISTKAFNSELFSYSTYVDSSFNTRGTLAVNPAATAALCPAGRILHANGKFLSTGVNPDLTAGGTTYPYLMGVLDSVTGLNGYINPASATFANYDVNLPVQYDGGNLSIVPPLGGQGAKLQVGPATNQAAVFTVVTTNASANITISDVTQGTIQIGALISGPGMVASQTIVSQTSGTTGGAGVYVISANATTAGGAGTGAGASSGLVGGANQDAGAACVGQFVMDGAATTTVLTTACTATSFVFLQQLGGDITTVPTVLSANGSFIVTVAAAVKGGAYSFLIVN